MCGIAGFFYTRPVSRSTANAMLGALRQRGPDAEHIVAWNNAFARTDLSARENHSALLHTRLSIIDPRPAADQPMANETGDVWICYNGEVYDYADQRKKLSALGVTFRTRSDTEFILKAYETWGIDALLPMLRGMFALAIVDLKRRAIHLARDRFGEKPLLYLDYGKDFAFASLVRALIPLLPAERRVFNDTAIDAYLAHRYIPAPLTIFPDIKRLENGYRLEFDLDSRQLKKYRYWQPAARHRPWLDELDASVRLRTVADRPLGVLLSSGIDSSVVASSLARQQLASFSTYTAAFPGSPLDESEKARSHAETLGFANHAVHIPLSIGDDFERIVADLDQPFADPSSLPTWYLAREVSRHAKVVLVGDGGDELFAGYKRLRKHLTSAWRRGFRLPLPIRPALQGKGFYKWTTEMAMDWLDAYSLRFSGFTPSQRLYLQGRRPLKQLSYWRLPEWSIHHPAARQNSALEDLLSVDFANYLPEYILQKSDLCTMAHGLEARAPLLDHPILECLMTIPEKQRYTAPPKQLFKEALDPRLVSSVFSGKKRGFNPPLHAWLHRELSPRLPELGDRLAALTQGQIDANAVKRFVRAYLDGHETFAEQLLQLLILDASLQQLRALPLVMQT